jgi:HAD superfamily hydrolase (TIGR01484 family)
MADALTALLDQSPVCIISGGQFAQFTSQVLNNLPDAANLTNLHLMPTCGTRYLRHLDGAWQEIYANDLTPEERNETLAVLEREAKNLNLWAEETWGPILEDRGSQITFSALGQDAPHDKKKAWDPTGERRAVLRDAVAAHLPDLEVRSGGSTSLDITRAGIDKAYGMSQLSAHTGINLTDMLFIGDRLDEGGNDFPVIALGVSTHPVTSWEDTATFVERLLA